MTIRKHITEPKSPVRKTKQGPCPRSGRRGSRKLSLAEMERLAADVTTEFLAACVKLRELKPKIEQIRLFFQKNVRGSVTLAGCGSFRDFCKMHLHRTEQAVYKMLSSDSKRQQEKKKNVPKSPTTHREPVISKADTQRLRAACLAAARHFDAEDTGNKPEASKAKEEFFAIVHTLRFFETGGAGHGRQRSLYRDAERERQRKDRTTSTAPISSSTPPPLSSPPLPDVGGTLNSSELDYAVSG
jgi:hypothetical protein